MNKVGEKLRTIRIEAGITQIELAAAFKTTRQFISNYERGLIPFPLKYFRKLPEPIRDAYRETLMAQYEAQMR